MAFDPFALSKRFLIEVELDAAFTLRVAKDDITMADGGTYLGVVASVPTLSRSAGALLDPRIVLPAMTITLHNTRRHDEPRIQDYLDAYTWANKPVALYLGQGETFADYDLIWEGVVQFPGGIYYDEEVATITVVDARAADARTLPTRIYTKTLYPNMEDQYVNTPIPLVYGDWTSGAGNGAKVPCVQIDSSVGTGGKFKVADHALKQIATVYKNGSSVSFTGNASLGEFTLNVTYTPGTDVITAHVQGATSDGTTGGTLLQTAPDVLDDLLTTWLAVPTGRIDSAAFTAWAGSLTTDDYVRRVINTETDSNQLIAELLREGWADLSIEAGKYFPRYRAVIPSGTLPSYREPDLVGRSGSSIKEFSVERDPDLIYCNEVASLYGYDPVAAVFTSRYDTENTGEITTVGSRKRRTMEFYWLYKALGVSNRSDKELYTFSVQPEVVNITVGPPALIEGPADQFRLIYNKYPDADGGTPFQIRDIAINPDAMTARIRAWNMGLLSGATWTEDGSVTWLTATSTQRNSKGFWSDDNGFADTSITPDPASQKYRWG